MKSWQLAVVGLASLAVAGCRTDPNIALLERELRLQEDKTYEFQKQADDCRLELESARSQNATLRKRLGLGPDEADGPPQWDTGDQPPAPLLPPVIQLPTETVPKGQIPDTLRMPGRLQEPSGPAIPGPAPPDDEQPDDEQPDVGPPDPATGPAAPTAAADSSQVTRLLLDPGQTGGLDADRRPGDEGIRLVLQPCDDRGRPLMAPADVAVVVIDPALAGEAARVARWDFSAEQTAGRFRPSGAGGELALEMPWPSRPPVHENLELFVRYTTGDGRRLQAEAPIRVDLALAGSPGWVPRQGSGPELPAGPTRPPDTAAPTPATGPSRPPALRTATAVNAAPPPRPSARRPVWSPFRR